MAGYLNFTGKVLLAELAMALGGKLMGRGGPSDVDDVPKNLDQRTIDRLESFSMVNQRGGFEDTLDEAGVAQNRIVRDAMWKYFRSL